MTADDFNNRIKALYPYCASPYFCGNLTIFDDQAQKEQLFLAMPKDHQYTYGQTYLQFTDTWEELLNKFGAYHNSDVISGHYGTIKKSCNYSLASMTKRPSSFSHPPASRARHGSSQRQGQSSYNNWRSNYNCSDRSYNDSCPDNCMSYRPKDSSSRTTGKHSSRSNHQSGERRYERNGNTNGNANGSSNLSINYRSSCSNNHSQNRGISHHDSHHVNEYNDRSLSHSQSPGRRSPSPQARKRNNNRDRSNSSDCGRNNHNDDEDCSLSPEEAFHVGGNFSEDPVPQGNKPVDVKIKKSVAVDAQMALLYEWDARPVNKNAINRAREANRNKNWSVAPVEKDQNFPSDTS